MRSNDISVFAQVAKGATPMRPASAILSVVLFVALTATASAQQASSSRSFYDRMGRFVGSASNTGHGTTDFRDRIGRLEGSAIQNSDKTTTYYDRMGRFIGSSRD